MGPVPQVHLPPKSVPVASLQTFKRTIPILRSHDFLCASYVSDITARIAVVDKLVQNGILAEIQKQLTKEGTNKAKLAQCLAEVAKVGEF